MHDNRIAVANEEIYGSLLFYFLWFVYLKQQRRSKSFEATKHYSIHQHGESTMQNVPNACERNNTNKMCKMSVCINKWMQMTCVQI